MSLRPEGPGRPGRILSVLAAGVPAALAMVLVIVAIFSLVGEAPGGDRSSVLFIIIDTVRADHIGCFGYERNTSPNIDKFSRESVFFKNAISPAPWTTPAVASMFTAQHPRVLGYENEVVVLEDQFVSLPEIFKDNGFTTHGIIAHLYIAKELGFGQGFDSYDEENAKGHGHVSSPSVTDKAISFMREHKDEKFFLFVHYFDPHCDYILHKPYDFYPDYEGSVESGEPIEELREKAPQMSEQDVAYLNALYDSEIRFTDEHLGRLLTWLRDEDLYDDALIVIVADHGEEFLERGDHWIGHTKTVYQELIHVPLMIKLPHQAEGRIVEDWVTLVDLMPTVVDYAGLEVPDGYVHDGDVIDLEGSQQPETRPIFSETMRWGTMRSVIQDNWKLTYDQTTNTTTLFNLADDPGETVSLVKEKGALVRSMLRTLIDWESDMRASRWNVRRRHPSLTRDQLEQLKSLGYIR